MVKPLLLSDVLDKQGTLSWEVIQVNTPLGKPGGHVNDCIVALGVHDDIWVRNAVAKVQSRLGV